ncbi:hypothetical protein [Xenorhabdus ishibashii]|uniref:Uncharacterized protein n=1 Tax=Xenorhabdus ishibashii TaxID=1034471 RepID=A0A2D0K829_9GAMM|nr:hypothetical protein [Xenorhabdus ishibashii]PHM59542.1 hypothetical protein Xish_03661 [Xenorhabdus ishibashii]
MNKIKSWYHCIHLTSPKYKDYSVCVRKEKDRLIIHGSIDTSLFSTADHQCTVSDKRKPEQIARDITRKILNHLDEEIQEYKKNIEEYEIEKEKERILKGMISRFGSLTPHYNAFTGFNTVNKIYGFVEKYSRRRDDYNLKIKNLTTDQLIKIIGFITTL